MVRKGRGLSDEGLGGLIDILVLAPSSSQFSVVVVFDINNMNPEYPDSSSNGARLQHIESLSISPELFEKLYLSPQNKVKGELRGTFGNPTPVYVSLFYFIE